MTQEIVVADIGGTHARFAIAEIGKDGGITLTEPIKMATADHANLQIAWEAFGTQISRALPDFASIAVAAPIRGDRIKMTNNPWVIEPDILNEKLGLNRHILINDFEAVAYAAASARQEDFTHITGPEGDLPSHGVMSVIGPGTGLGVGMILRQNGHLHILPTEGGHIDFAPLDAIDDRILAYLRGEYLRVSVERVAAGSGLRAIWNILADMEGQSVPQGDDKHLWTVALSGNDNIGNAALDRFCMILGSVAGDIALTHGPGAVVLAGGLGARLADHLPQSGFADRFTAKGRYRSLMEGIPVKQISLPEPGLLGAAAAYIAQN